MPDICVMILRCPNFLSFPFDFLFHFSSPFPTPVPPPSLLLLCVGGNQYDSSTQGLPGSKTNMEL